MCKFLDDKLVMEKLETIRMTFKSSIMKLENNVSTDRFRLALDLPRAEFFAVVKARNGDKEVLGTLQRGTYHLQECDKVVL
jgi:hypothetical protein